jgi:hypothetical protein
MRSQNGFGEIVGGELVGAARRQPSPAPPGRICTEPGCATVLSIYNSDQRCTRHSFLRVDVGAGHRVHVATEASRSFTAA